jgi:hypothetical protein
VRKRASHGVIGTGGAWRCGLWVLALALAPGTARAQDPAFGSPGQKVVSGAIHAELDIGSGAPDTVEVARDWVLGFSPSVFYFAAQDLALGVSPSVAYEDIGMTVVPYTQVDVALSLGAGWNIPLSDGVTLFPQLWIGLGYLRRRYEEFSIPGPYRDPSFPIPESNRTESGGFAMLQLPLPLQFQLGFATYIAIGPRAFVRVPLADGSAVLRVGLSAEFGAFF